MATRSSSRTLTDISVEGVQKRKIGPNKQNVYAVKVTWSDGTVNVIYRSYRNFHQLEEKLLQSFNEASSGKTKKSRVIPKLQGKDRMKSDEKKKWEWIDNFSTELLDLPTAISECDIVEEFFTPTPQDLTSNKRRKEEEKFNKAKKKKEKKRLHWKTRNTIKMIGSPIRMQQYKVLEDYEQQSDKEISLQGGMTVFVISKRDDGWWMVNSGEETGWAPGSYLESTNTEDEEQDVKEAAIGEGEMYYSLKPYKAKEDDELSFPTGVTLQILRENLDGWWTAIYMGRRGYVPALHLNKLHEKKKHQRRHFSIKRLTIKSRKKSSHKISRAKETREDKATVNNNFTLAKEQQQKTGKTISFDDDLGIPSRSKMSMKRKRVHIVDQNQNAQAVPLGPSEQKIASESAAKTQEIKVDEVGTSDRKEFAHAQQQLKPLCKKKSNTFPGMTSLTDFPSIRVTRPTVKQRARSLSLGSADEPRGIYSSILHEVPTASHTYDSQPTGIQYSATGAYNSPLNNGRQNSSQQPNLPMSHPLVLSSAKERKHSLTGSENSSTSDSPGSSPRRRKGAAANPTSVGDGSIHRPLGPGDIHQALDTQTPLLASSRLKNEKNEPRQIASKVLKRKASQSLTRFSTLQFPNLASYGSMPDIRQAGTHKATDWHPQDFTDLHPEFQRKAIKIASKTIRSMNNQVNDRARPRSLEISRLEGGSLGRYEPNTFSAKKCDSSLASKRKEQYSSMTTIPRAKKTMETTRNAFSAHAYSDVDLQSLRLGNNRMRFLSPLTRPRSQGSAVGSYPCSCASSAESPSELEFNSDESEDQIRWNGERAYSSYGFSALVSDGNEGYRNSGHDFDLMDPAPTYSLPECPDVIALPAPAIYRAVCRYEAENEQELSFLEGEELEVIRRAENGWWLGKIGDDKGWVPSNYLRPVSSSPVVFVPLQILRPFGNHAQFPLQ